MNKLQIVLIAVVLVAGPSLACRGCIDLDDLTYDKLLKKFKWAIVKFDVAFPYGDKHEAYSELAKELAGVDDLMVATVGIKDYGDKDNNELGARYGIKEGDFPIIKLFKNGLADAPVNFDQAVTTDNLKSFLRENTGLYIGLAGCLENFDKLATAFIQALPNAKAELAKAKELVKELEANQPQVSNPVMYIRHTGANCSFNRTSNWQRTT
jgi:endoplasmic reticulum protein 29